MSARTSPRALLGASAVAVTVMGPVAHGSAPELDARLIKRVAELVALQAKIAALCDETDGLLDKNNKITDQARSVLLDRRITDLQLKRFWPLADKIAGTQARTPEGIRAKAKAARLVWLELDGDDGGHIARHFFGLVRDILGES